jgi:hypothetical protein
MEGAAYAGGQRMWSGYGTLRSWWRQDVVLDGRRRRLQWRIHFFCNLALVAVNVVTYAVATVFLFLRVFIPAFINTRTDWSDCKMVSLVLFVHSTDIFTHTLPDPALRSRRRPDCLYFDW